MLYCVCISIIDEGARICLNLPFPVFRLGAKHGMLSISYQGSEGEINAEQVSKAMASVDFQHIVALIESGVTGMLVQVQDVLTIWTE